MERKDLIETGIFITILILLFCFLISNIEVQKQDIYIQNLEEKLNIYEKSYEEFCLEDSLRQ